MTTPPPSEPGPGPGQHPWGAAPGVRPDAAPAQVPQPFAQQQPPGTPNPAHPTGPQAPPPGVHPANWLRPGTVALRPLGISGILEGAFRSYRWNPRAMVLVPLVVLAIILAVSSPLAWQTSDEFADLGAGGYSIDALLRLVLGLMVPLILPMVAALGITPLATLAAFEAVSGHRSSLGELWRAIRGRIPRFLLLSLILGLAQAVAWSAGTVLIGIAVVGAIQGTLDWTLLLGGLAALLIAFILTLWIGTRLTLAAVIVVIEPLGVIASIKRSWRLTAKAFWSCLATIIVSQLIAWVAAQAISSVLQFGVPLIATLAGLAADQVTRLTFVMGVLVQAITMALVLPYSAAITTLLYVDRRMRSEAFDAELIARHQPAQDAAWPRR